MTNEQPQMLLFRLQTISLFSLDLPPPPSKPDDAGHETEKTPAIMIHSEASSLREQYIEYGFLADMCREMWRRGTAMDVLHCHTDRSGYDVVLDAGGVQRHVQLKSSFDGAKTSRQKINVRLSGKPSGCIVWIRFDPNTLEQTSYLWFGGDPGNPLPGIGDRIAKHSKGDRDGTKAERPDIRVINKGQFSRVKTIGLLADLLFGRSGPAAGT